MKSRERFIQSVTAAAKECGTKLPYARGATRQAFVLKRNQKAQQRKSA